jgi:hypothetical protein
VLIFALVLVIVMVVVALAIILTEFITIGHGTMQE